MNGHTYFYDGMTRRTLQTCIPMLGLGVDLTLTVWHHLNFLAAVLLALFFSLIVLFWFFSWWIHALLKLWLCPWPSSGLEHLSHGAFCGFSGRFEDASFSMKTKMKICSNLHWRIKMWKPQISGLLKNEDYQLPHLLKMNIALLKLLTTEDVKNTL